MRNTQMDVNTSDYDLYGEIAARVFEMVTKKDDPRRTVETSTDQGTGSQIQTNPSCISLIFRQSSNGCRSLKNTGHRTP